MHLWRCRDYVDDEWIYSEVPVNPENFTYIECMEIKYVWIDGELQ